MDEPQRHGAWSILVRLRRGQTPKWGLTPIYGGVWRTFFCALLSMAVALFIVTSAQAAARTPFQIRCEDTISKTVSVLTAKRNGYTIDNHLSARTLTVMKDVAPPNVFVAGLTKTESKVEIGLGGPILQDAVSGYECVAPQIEVELYNVPVVIYIAKELPVDSCAYKEVLTHEMRHLQAYNDHLPKVEKTVREALLKRFADKPLYAPSGTAMSALEHEIDSGWMPYIRGELAKVEIEQAAIDSPAEYERLGKVCGGEVTSLLSKLRPPVPAR